MYETLMGLPMFNGVSYNRISEIVGSTRLAFLKYLPGEVFIQQHEPCNYLKFIISGSARIEVKSHDGRFAVSSTLTAPAVVMPDYLFGRSTLYPCKATAIETLSIMQIAKSDFTRILSTDEIFLFNYLNIISSDAQKSIDGVLALTSGTLDERIAFWIVALTQQSATDIELTCRQRDLCAVFGVQRSSFIATLDSMRDRGLIEYSPDRIKVISRREISRLLVNQHD